MIRRRNRLASLILLTAFSLAGFAAPALGARGDDGGKLPPYDVSGMPHQRIWIPWIFAFVFFAGSIGVGLKNPHRTYVER